MTALLVNTDAVQSLNCVSNRAGARTNKINVTALLVNMDAVKSTNCVRNILGVKFTIMVITATSKYQPQLSVICYKDGLILPRNQWFLLV